MATKKTETIDNASSLNVYQKLLKARVLFLEKDVKKTGMNRHLEFKYFELQDIVPPITDIGNALGLLFITTFTNEIARMTVVNTDIPAETIIFESPMKEIESKVSSRTGTDITNPIQNLGSAETYQRRYLYLTALDIVENDGFDSDTGSGSEKTTESKTTPSTASAKSKKVPATVEERSEIKKDIVGSDKPADALQIKALKDSLKKLLELDPEQESFVQEIAVKTNGFAEVTKKACEALIVHIGDMIEAYNASTTAE